MLNKSFVIVAALIVILLVPGCESLTGPEKKANVVMIEGPISEDGYSIFYVKGRVQNKGDNTAMFTTITIYIRNSLSGLLAQETTYIDDTELVPGETSPWDTIFSDSGRTIRDQMDFSKTTFEIKWDEKKSAF
jgi:hypothetical protein